MGEHGWSKGGGTAVWAEEAADALSAIGGLLDLLGGAGDLEVGGGDNDLILLLD